MTARGGGVEAEAAAERRRMGSQARPIRASADDGDDDEGGEGAEDDGGDDGDGGGRGGRR